MPKIVVTSKTKFPEWVRRVKSSGEPWAYISVEGTNDLVEAGSITDNHHFLPADPDVLNLDFDDVERYQEVECKRPAMIIQIYPPTENQAREIVEFGRSHQRHNLLIHCYAGRSRSVGIAQGLLDLFPGVWEIDPESNPLITPNLEVLRLLHKVGWGWE